MRSFSSIDKFISQADSFLTTIWGNPTGTGESNPAEKIKPIKLNKQEKKQSIALMRVNHTGEVCAQALYQSQSLFSHNEQIKKELEQSSIEENNHLIWCNERINQLGGKPSILNPIFYSHCFVIGILAANFGDEYSLGFVEETEKQVETHLKKYIQRLPEKDEKSKAILEKMKEDEINHGKKAKSQGAKPLPFSVRKIMSITSKVMTKTTYYI